MHIVLLLLAAALLLRILYRTVLDFPPYPGRSPLDGTNVDGLMEEERFWALIAESRRRGGGNTEDQMDALVDLLEHERLPDIIAFHKAFMALHERVNDFGYWERAYALNWGCSDDVFDYFRGWWIAQGRNKFYWSVRFPRLLFFFAVRESDRHPYEGFESCAIEAYENLTKRPMPSEPLPDIEDYEGTRGKLFNEGLAFVKHPELAFLAW